MKIFFVQFFCVLLPVCLTLQPHGLHGPWDSPGQNTGVGSLLQGIFPTQGPNPGHPRCKYILYQLNHKVSPYSCHVFLISSASVRSVLFLSFIVPIFAWSVPLVSLIFLKRSLIFPILLFSSVSLHCSLRKAFLSLLTILWNSAFRWVYLSFSPLPFTSLLYSAICKVSSDNHLPSCISFAWGWFRLPPLYSVTNIRL